MVSTGCSHLGFDSVLGCAIFRVRSLKIRFGIQQWISMKVQWDVLGFIATLEQGVASYWRVSSGDRIDWLGKGVRVAEPTKGLAKSLVSARSST